MPNDKADVKNQTFAGRRTLVMKETLELESGRQTTDL